VSRPEFAPTLWPNSPGHLIMTTCRIGAAAVGPATLIIIDEAGMADTLSLDTAVRFAVDRGASVRLIGDDQQLAAIGAGGVLRDIMNSHSALHLTELHCFTNPAQAQASLALREGDPSALGFYLDQGRLHVGDLAKITEDTLAAWVQDRSAGLDAIMLAPTRELVAELNRRARDHRLDGAPAGQEVRLADGNQASVGNVIITRANDRRLRLSATDWVKNGDRWSRRGWVRCTRHLWRHAGEPTRVSDHRRHPGAARGSDRVAGLRQKAPHTNMINRQGVASRPNRSSNDDARAPDPSILTPPAGQIRGPSAHHQA
jgi:AAA domain